MSTATKHRRISHHWRKAHTYNRHESRAWNRRWRANRTALHQKSGLHQ